MSAMNVILDVVRRLGGDTSNIDGNLDDIVSAHNDSHHSPEEAFQEVYFLMVYMSALWFVGRVCIKIGMPALVGEIIVGILLGPQLAGFVPYHNALIVIGEIGLVLLVLEAGIDVDIGMLKLIGFRGLIVAIFGSMLPLGMGIGLAWLNGETIQTSIAIGACFAPTSMGIALNVLRSAKVLNTPVGQLIIAAAVLDDVIALMLLSELEAMQNPTVMNIILPLIVSPVLIIVFGYLGIKWVPRGIKKVMQHVSPKYQENAILFFLFIATFLLIPGCYYAGSSHLLGAFLAGLMFCTDHTIHKAWKHQIKRILQWMLRVFFSATIGFEVPIQDFWSQKVLKGAFLYTIAILGKLATGIFAKPHTWKDGLTISFSMSAWGEFAFILATSSYETGTINKDAFSSILLAVLISVIFSPYALRITLSYFQYKKQQIIHKARSKQGPGYENVNSHPVYYCIHTKGRGKWGHQDRLLRAIYKLSLEIIDFRAWHAPEYNDTHHLPLVQDVFYVLDTTLNISPSKFISEGDKSLLRKRCKTIKHALKEALQAKTAKVDIMRWLPGVRKSADDEHHTYRAPNTEYCRQAAYKQAQLALDHEESIMTHSQRNLYNTYHSHPYHSLRSNSGGITSKRSLHGIDKYGKKAISFRGDVVTKDDDLITINFMDSLREIHAKLTSPIPSPEPSHDDNKNDDLSEEKFKVKELTQRISEVDKLIKKLENTAMQQDSLRNNNSYRSLQPLIAQTNISANSNSTHSDVDTKGHVIIPLYPNDSIHHFGEAIDGNITITNRATTPNSNDIQHHFNEHSIDDNISHPPSTHNIHDNNNNNNSHVNNNDKKINDDNNSDSDSNIEIDVMYGDEDGEHRHLFDLPDKLESSEGPTVRMLKPPSEMLVKQDSMFGFLLPPSITDNSSNKNNESIQVKSKANNNNNNNNTNDSPKQIEFQTINIDNNTNTNTNNTTINTTINNDTNISGDTDDINHENDALL